MPVYSRREMGRFSRSCKLGTFYGLSAVFLGLAILTLVAWNKLYDSIIYNAFSLTEKSRIYDMWIETPIPMHIEFYLYNWTNAQEVVDSNFEVKPNFVEVGPYVYEEIHYRVNLQWHDNGTVTYQQERRWHYLPELSNADLDDEITNVNVISVTVGYAVRQYGTLIKTVVNRFLESMNETLIVTRKARELLFEGYTDPLLELASRLNLTDFDFNIPFDKFGWFYDRNNSATYDGTFNMYTGVPDLKMLGIIALWNNSTKTSFYEGDCDYVNGTSGELWPPIGKADKIAIFSPDVCSTLWLEYEEDITLRGVSARKYISSNYTLDNGGIFPETACFNLGDKVPYGVRNVSQCKFGAPAFVSLPHFYLADEEYKENISGMNPDKSRDEFFLSLEPSTGIPLNVRAQMQINILMQPIPGLGFFSNVKETFVPVLWFRQTANLTEEYASQLRTLLNVPDIAVYSGYSILGLGIIFLIVGIYFTFRINKREETLTLIPNAT